MALFDGFSYFSGPVPGLSQPFALVWDPGSSFSVPSYRTDFPEHVSGSNEYVVAPESREMVLQGLTKGLQFVGHSIALYSVATETGDRLQMRCATFHVLDAPRLMSPQAFLLL